MESIILKCRGCLKEEEDMKLLFFSYEGTTTLAKMLEGLGFTVVKEEEYSNQLCRSCSQILVDFTNFKTSFQQATEYFKSIISQNMQNISSINQISSCKDFIVASENECKSREIDVNNDVVSGDVIHQDIANSSELPNGFDITFFPEKKSHFKSKQSIFCQMCGDNFKSKLQLRRHENSLHKVNCQQKKQVKQFLSEKSHHESGLPLVKLEEASEKLCKICKQTFLSDEYDFHFEIHKIHECKICGHRFIRKAHLNDHEEIHLNVCKYVCQHCGKAFKLRTSLNKHRRIHTNPREEICDVCGQRFNTRETLKTHYKLKHIKSRDFQCNICGLAFPLKSTLEKHIERHNPNRKKKYSCNLCNASYINKYNLSRHSIIKHTAFENRPSCEFCDKRYVNKTDLIKHLKKRHGQNLESHKSIAVKSDQ